MTETFHLLIPLGFSLILGGLVGLEQESRSRWAGFRTHVMVSLTVAFFLIIGITKKIDLGHVMEGIIAGIGFLGGGTILKLTNKMEVKGLTTASTIWLSAGIGMTCGVEMYGLATVAALISVTVLLVGGLFEGKVTESLSPDVSAPVNPKLLQRKAADEQDV
ncbi:MAG: MgtC/SapB family protein [Gemmatales bacterium]